MSSADVRIRWILDVVNSDAGKLLRDDRQIRSSLEQTDRIQRKLAQTSTSTGQAMARSAGASARALELERRAIVETADAQEGLARAAQRTGASAQRSSQGLRTQAGAASVAARDIRELNQAQATAISAGARLEQASSRAAAGYRQQARAATEANRVQAAAAREQTRIQNRGAAAAVAGAGITRGRLPSLTGPAVLAGAGVIADLKAFAGFEQQMARVQAVAQATRGQLAAMTKQAEDLGAKTSFSAKDAANGMYELATAGFKASEVMKAIPGTLDLAAASGIDLGRAAEIQAAALRGFGLQASQAGRVADALTSTVNSSAVEMDDLGESLKYIAPVARASGQSMETMLAAIGLMGNVGIKGSQAGTSLRTAMVRLTAPTEKSANALEDLGIKAESLRGPHGLIPLPAIMEKIAAGSKKVDKGTRNAALAAIFGREALSGMIALVDKGPAALERQTDALRSSEGQARRTAQVMRQNVAGAWDNFTGSLETAAITVTQKFSPAIQHGLTGAAHAVNDLANAATGGRGHGLAYELVGDVQHLGGEVVAFGKQLAPARSAIVHLFAPVAEGGGQVLLATLKLSAGATIALAHGLGEVGDALQGHETLVKAIGVGLTIWAVRSDKLVSTLGRLPGIGRLLQLGLAPVGLLMRGLDSAPRQLGAVRAGWLGVAAAERTAAVQGTAANTAAGLGTTRGGRAAGRMSTLAAEYSIARQYGGSGALGAAGGASRLSALRSTLGPVAAGALRAIGPQALGISLISGMVSGITSQRDDFGGKFQDFLHGATFGAIHGAGISAAQRVRKEYTDGINRGLEQAAKDVQKGAGYRAIHDVLAQRRDVQTTDGGLLGRAHTESLNLAGVTRLEQTLEQRRAELLNTPLESGHAGGKVGVSRSNVRDQQVAELDDQLKRVKAARDELVKGAPKIAKLFAGRADLTSLVQMRRELRSVGLEGTRTFAQITAAQRSARGSTFQAQTRNLGRGAATSLGEVRDAVDQANKDLARRGVQKGTADFARDQEQLTAAAVRNIRKLVKDGTISADQGRDAIRKLLKQAQADAGQTLQTATRNGVRGLDAQVVAWGNGLKRAGKVTDAQVGKIGDSLAKLPSKARRESAQAMVLMARELESQGKLPKGSADRLVFLLQSRFADLGNIDEPIKAPVAKIKALLDSLHGPADGAGGAMDRLKGHAQGLAGAIRAVADTVASIPWSAIDANLQGITTRDTSKSPRGRRRGGVTGTQTIAAAGGEMLVEPGGHASMILGDPTSDSTIIDAPIGSVVLTGHGIGLAGAGMPLDEVVRHQLPHFNRGGHVHAGVYGSTAYGPPWGGIQGRGITSTGVNLTRSPHLYGVAVDPRQISLGELLYAWPNPFGYSGRFRAFDTGGAIKGNRLDFYDWRGRGAQRSWGRRNVHVSENRISNRRGAATFTSPGGAGSPAAVRILGKSRSRAGFVDDAYGQGFTAGAGGLTRGWIAKTGNPILDAIRAEQASAAGPTGGTKSERYRRPDEGKSGSVVKLRSVAAQTNAPYVWGGGHQGYSAHPRGLDCSGYVSHVVHYGGANPDLKSPVTTNGTATYGRGGRGRRVTIHTRTSAPAHTMLTIDGVGYSSGNRATGRKSGRHDVGAAYLQSLPIKRHPIGMRTGGVVGLGQAVGSATRGNVRGVGPTLTAGVASALTLAAGTLEALDRLIGAATASRLEALRKYLLAKVRAGGPQKVVQRYQEMLDTVDYELGRRAGAVLSAVQQETDARSFYREALSRTHRREGIAEDSVPALEQDLAVTGIDAQVAERQLRELQNAQQDALKHGDKDAAEQIGQQITETFAALDEAVTRQIELRRQIIQKRAQDRVDAADFGVSSTQGILGELDAAQRLAGVRGAAAAGPLAGAIGGWLSSIEGGGLASAASADSVEGMRQRAASIATGLVPQLQNQRGALEGQFQAAMATGDAAGARTAWQAIQQNATDIANALADSAELLRDAAVKAADDLVSNATHGTSMANLGLQHLELEQQLAGTYDTGGQARADYIKSTVVPALQGELDALTDKLKVQQEQGVSLADIQATMEAIAAKNNEILQADVDANEDAAASLQSLSDYGGSLGFDYRGTLFTDAFVGR